MLKGKVAVVTGSTSGIGLAIARCLAKQGADIVITGSRAEEEGKKVVEQLENEFKVKGAYCQADFSSPQTAAEKLISFTTNTFGALHILVNNAGIQFISSVENFPPEKWDLLLSVNLSSAFHTMRLAIPVMKKNENKWGRIVNISSVHGLVASINKSAYVASKHGLNGLTKVAALENAADTNITCNAICPGFVETPLIEHQVKMRAQQKNLSYEEAKADLVGEKQPTKRCSTVDAIGEYVVFLCTEAGANITGSEQVIDGGWTTQ